MNKRDWEWMLGGLGLVGAGIATGGFGIPALLGGATAGLGAGGAGIAAGDALATGATAGMGGGIASLFGPSATQAGLAGLAGGVATPALGQIGADAITSPLASAMAGYGTSALAAPSATTPSLFAQGIGALRSPGMQAGIKGLQVADAMSPQQAPPPAHLPQRAPFQPTAVNPYAREQRRKYQGLAGYL